MSAFLSGEMKDTVQMNPAGAYGALDIYVFLLWEPNMLIFSSRAILFTERKKEIIPKLGREC